MNAKKRISSVLISLAISGTATTLHAQEISIQQSDSLRENKTAAPARQSSSVYIVQLKAAPGVSHAEKIGELIPRQQRVVNRGNQYNADSSRMRAYVKALKNSQTKIASTGNIDILHRYVHTFNGFSARMTPSQAAALRQSSEVAGVWEDKLMQVDTTNTPEFLGLTGPGGQHTLGIKGEDIIVGVMDTGITPENPSFADDGSYSDPSELGWQGVCDKGEEAEENTFQCNNKLIGARYFKETFESQYDIRTQDGEFISPRDADGHGSHTSGTAAGNENVEAFINGTSVGMMSGIAPRARIAMYKVCWNSDYTNPQGDPERGCFYGDTMAAIDQAVVDGVDVINYSIGGSRDDLTIPPTAAMLRATQAGVYVSVSAGNDGPTVETIGTPAPWVTTVAASTYEGESYTNALYADIGGETLEYAFVEGAITKPLSQTGTVSGEVVIADPILGCYENETPAPLDNAAEVEGKIVLIQRGVCTFVEKVDRAQRAGAIAVVIYSDGRPVTALGGDGFSADIPGGMISTEDGEALVAQIQNGATVSITLSPDFLTTQPETGNIMAEFSSRGPNLSTRDVIKPDITAPGVRILAATTDTPMYGDPGQQVRYLSGTSMSSPHVAGMAALLMDQHPEWSPAQVKSALMTTAYQDVVKEDEITPADPFDFGAGHANPVPAMSPGLTFNATFDEYLAFLCGLNEETFVTAQSGKNCDVLESEGQNLDPSQLNYPSMAIGELTTTETLYRTVTDVTGAEATYSFSYEGLEGLEVSFTAVDSEGAETPAESITVPANGSAKFGVTFAKTESTELGTWQFGAVTLQGSNGENVRSAVAVMPVPEEKIVVPDSISMELNRGVGSFPVEMLYTGRASIEYKGLSAPFYSSGTVGQDNDREFAFMEDGVKFFGYLVQEGTTLIRFSLRDSLVSVPDTDLDLYVYRCENFSCTRVGQSFNAGSNEDVIITNPEPAADVSTGTYYVINVHGYDLAGEETADFVMPLWLVDSVENRTRFSMSPRAIEGRYNHVRVVARGLEEDTIYMGTVTFFNEDGEAEGTTAVEATLK